MAHREVGIIQGIPFSARGCFQCIGIRDPGIHLSTFWAECKTVKRVMVYERRVYKSTRAQRSPVMTGNSFERELTKFVKNGWKDNGKKNKLICTGPRKGPLHCGRNSAVSCPRFDTDDSSEVSPQNHINNRSKRREETYLSPLSIPMPVSKRGASDAGVDESVEAPAKRTRKGVTVTNCSADCNSAL